MLVKPLPSPCSLDRPPTTLTCVSLPSPPQTFLWHQDEVVVSWLEQQVSSPTSSVRQNAECVKKEQLLRQIHK